MTLTVRERADAVSTLRYIFVYVMETVARWVPTTPEMEIKILFGRHLWDLAQHADALGRRTAELRLPYQTSRAPTHAFMAVLEEFAGIESTEGRVAGLYDGVLPIVSGLCQVHLAEVDELLDEPTIRILERIILDIERMRVDRDKGMQDAPVVPPDPCDWVSELRKLADGASDWIDYRPPSAMETATA